MMKSMSIVPDILSAPVKKGKVADLPEIIENNCY